MFVKIFVKCLCLYHGYKVKTIQDRAAVIAYYQLRNKVYQQMYQIEPKPIPDVLRIPKGLTRWFGIYHKDQLIASAKLSDLAHEISIVQQLYSKLTFAYSPEDTYEFTGLLIDTAYQGKSRSLFYILMAITHWYTLATNKKRWLVSTARPLYQRLLRMGLTLEYISDDINIIDDGSHQSQFALICQKKGILKDSCCFYAYQPKNLPMMQFKKFIKYQFKRWF